MFSPCSGEGSARRVAQTAGGEADIHQLADQPAAAVRRHGLLRVQGSRVPAAGDPVDAPRTPPGGQDEVQVHVRSVQRHHNTHHTRLTRSRRRLVWHIDYLFKRLQILLAGDLISSQHEIGTV